MIPYLLTVVAVLGGCGLVENPTFRDIIPLVALLVVAVVIRLLIYVAT